MFYDVIPCCRGDPIEFMFPGDDSCMGESTPMTPILLSCMWLAIILLSCMWLAIILLSGMWLAAWWRWLADICLWWWWFCLWGVFGYLGVWLWPASYHCTGVKVIAQSNMVKGTALFTRAWNYGIHVQNHPIKIHSMKFYIFVFY